MGRLARIAVQSGCWPMKGALKRRGNLMASRTSKKSADTSDQQEEEVERLVDSKLVGIASIRMRVGHRGEG